MLMGRRREWTQRQGWAKTGRAGGRLIVKHEVLSMMNDTEYVRTQEGRRQKMAREAELELEVGKKEP